jgi:hypothetical protein
MYDPIVFAVQNQQKVEETQGTRAREKLSSE